jgi:integrase
VLLYLADRKARSISPRTLENERIRLCAFLKHAGLKIEPKIPKFKSIVLKPEIYTQAELDAIFAEAQPRDFWLFQTALKSGLRLQELMFLTFDDLLDSGIRVTAHGDWVPKDHEERIVKVPKSLIVSLRNLSRIETSNLVFPTQTGTENWHMLRSLKRTAKRADIPEDRAWMQQVPCQFLHHSAPCGNGDSGRDAADGSQQCEVNASLHGSARRS